MKKKNFEITENTVLKRNPEVQFSKIDNEVVLLSPDGTNYIRINEVGVRIWELLEKELSYADLIKKLLEEFEIDQGICETDVKSFLIKSIQNQLISISSITNF